MGYSVLTVPREMIANVEEAKQEGRMVEDADHVRSAPTRSSCG